VALGKAGQEAISTRSSDLAFLQTVASLDVRRHTPGLQALSASKFPDTPFTSKEVGVSADYSVHPPIFDVFLVEDQIRDQSLGRPGNASVLDYVRLTTENNSDSRFALRVCFHEGGTQKELFLLSLDLGTETLKGTEIASSRLKPGVVVDHHGRRSGGVDAKGCALATYYDEVDALYLPALMRGFCENNHPWQAVQRGLQMFRSDVDWPFENDIFSKVN